MMTIDPIEAEVTIDRGASPSELEGVAAAFRAVGIEPAVRAGYVQLSELPPWMVMAFLPITAFLTALGAEAGKDAYRRIKDLVQRVRDARAESKQPPGNFILEDTETKVQVVLGLGLIDEAYEALIRLDLHSLAPGPVFYDRTRGQWVSAKTARGFRQESSTSEGAGAATGELHADEAQTIRDLMSTLEGAEAQLQALARSAESKGLVSEAAEFREHARRLTQVVVNLEGYVPTS
jgi:hypothetical protein